MKVTILVIATNKYSVFIEPLNNSIKEYFLTNSNHDVEVIVFTDQEGVPSGCSTVFQKHLPWPHITLRRFHMFESISDKLLESDYVFYCDADMRFVSPVGNEILSTFAATLHPYFYNKKRDELHYEKNPESLAYVPPNLGTHYYMAAFFGGTSQMFVKVSSLLKDRIDKDLAHDYIAKWHDESHLNWYLANHPPSLQLDPGFCYPEGEEIPFEPKLLALSKNHAEFRKEGNVFTRWISRLLN